MKQEKNNAMNALLVEIELTINRRLFEKCYITEEMYHKAKDHIIKQSHRQKAPQTY